MDNIGTLSERHKKGRGTKRDGGNIRIGTNKRGPVVSVVNYPRLPFSPLNYPRPLLPLPLLPLKSSAAQARQPQRLRWSNRPSRFIEQDVPSTEQTLRVHVLQRLYSFDVSVGQLELSH